MDVPDSSCQTTTEGVEIRLDREILRRVDLWRSQQLDDPSRADALQRLVEVGLSLSSQGTGMISEGEKLILWVLQDLWKHQDVDVSDGIDLAFVCEMVSARQEWALKRKYPGVFTGSFTDPPEVPEVCDVLNMWSALERSLERLSGDERKRVEAAWSGASVSFSGFSVNDEIKHNSVADILINKLDKFESFEGRELNSIGPSLGAYRRMLTVFKRLPATSMAGDLSVDEIIDLMKAQIHPDNRGR